MPFRVPRTIIIALGALACAVTAQARPAFGAYAITTRHIPVQIGATHLRIAVYQSSAPGPTYINVHQDETTAVRTALARLRCCGGRLIEIQHGGQRYITFRLHGRRYKFDPNRIFTGRGARATLKWLGPTSPAAVAATRAFAHRLLAIAGIDALQRIIAVHNNTPGHYSAASYLKGRHDARDAAAVHIPRGADPDDFFFVTSPAIYDELRAQGRYAVVLQDNHNTDGDGSLSVYAARHGIVCLTIEAADGHRRTQSAMYRALATDLAIVDQLQTLPDAAAARFAFQGPRRRADDAGWMPDAGITGSGADPSPASMWRRTPQADDANSATNVSARVHPEHLAAQAAPRHNLEVAHR